MQKEITLFNSNNHYEGYNTKEDCYYIDDEFSLLNNPDIDDNSITFNGESCDESLDYFNSFLIFLKKSYEKRYKTIVEELALVGRVGRWNGKSIGGAIRSFDNPIPRGDWDSCEIMIDEEGCLFVRGYHHDNSDWMLFYFLTESNMKKAGIFNKYDAYGASSFDYCDFEKIENTLNPIKVPTNNGYYKVG